MPQHAKSILIVEDDADVRGALTAVLESEGYPVVEAAHGQEALQHLCADPAGFCMILLDLWMPVMNGWEFREKQLEDEGLAAIPTIIVTAHNKPEVSAAELKAATSIRKPIAPALLLETVGRYCTASAD